MVPALLVTSPKVVRPTLTLSVRHHNLCHSSGTIDPSKLDEHINALLDVVTHIVAFEPRTFLQNQEHQLLYGTVGRIGVDFFDIDSKVISRLPDKGDTVSLSHWIIIFNEIKSLVQFCNADGHGSREAKRHIRVVIRVRQ